MYEKILVKFPSQNIDNFSISDLIELKNRRVMGILQYHRIEQRPINYGDPVKPKTLIEELTPVKSEGEKSQDNILILRTPSTGKPDHLRVFIHVKNIVSIETWDLFLISLSTLSDFGTFCSLHGKNYYQTVPSTFFFYWWIEMSFQGDGLTDCGSSLRLYRTNSCQ